MVVRYIPWSHGWYKHQTDRRSTEALGITCFDKWAWHFYTLTTFRQVFVITTATLDYLTDYLRWLEQLFWLRNSPNLQLKCQNISPLQTKKFRELQNLQGSFILIHLGTKFLNTFEQIQHNLEYTSSGKKIPLFIFYSENIPLLNSAHFFYSSRKSKFIYHVFWTNHYSNLQWHQRELETWNSHQAGLVYLLTSKLFSQVILYLGIRMSNCFLFILLLFRCQ